MVSSEVARLRSTFLAKLLLALIPLAALALYGCKVGPDYKAPKIAVPDHFSEEAMATQPSTRSTSRPAGPATTTQPISADMLPPDYQRWWQTFNDHELNSLIERAATSNLDIATAIAQIEQARAQRGVNAAGLFPAASATGSYDHTYTGRTGNGRAAGTTNFWQAGLDSSWEIDLFGGVARSVESAEYTIEAQQLNRRAVTLSTMAEVASIYMDLRGSQRRLAIAQDQLKSQYQTLDLTRSKAQGGLIPYLNVAQQEATVATTASAIPPLETEVRQDIHALGLLLGVDPGALSAELSPAQPIPLGPPVVPPGLPSDLLRRRPDVGQAERLLAAATANIGVATADLFPKVSLTGQVGVGAPHLDQVFNYSRRFYSVGPNVTWDIFDAGQVWYQIHVLDAQQKQALAVYRKAVLSALRDVDDALVAYNREQARLIVLRQSVDANQRAFDLSEELFEKGRQDFLSVLVAEQQLFAAKDTEISSEEAVQADLVLLYKALGGGWEITEPPPETK